MKRSRSIDQVCRNPGGRNFLKCQLKTHLRLLMKFLNTFNKCDYYKKCFDVIKVQNDV